MEILPTIPEVAPLDAQSKILQRPAGGKALVKDFKSALYRAINSMA